jgi:hypothetical protein
MESLCQIAIEKEDIERLPSGQAVYAIFTTGADDPDEQVCRYVGIANDLPAALARHFRLTEPNIGLRYFLFSYKPKMLKFTIVPDLSSHHLKLLYKEWLNRYKPDLNLFDREVVLS